MRRTTGWTSKDALDATPQEEAGEGCPAALMTPNLMKGRRFIRQNEPDSCPKRVYSAVLRVFSRRS